MSVIFALNLLDQNPMNSSTPNKVIKFDADNVVLENMLL